MQWRRSKKRGVSAVVGTLFFILIVFVTISFFLVMFNSFSNYADTLKTVNQQQIQQKETQLSISNFTFGSSSGVNNAANTVSQSSTGYSQERKVLYSQGLWWVFYSYGARGSGEGLMYQSSPDGTTWSSPTSIYTIANTEYGFDFSVYQNGTYVDIVVASGSRFHWRYGIMNPSGMISFPYGFATQATFNHVIPSDGFCSIVTNNQGNTWVVLNTQPGSGTANLEVYEHLAPGNVNRGTWTSVDNVTGLPIDVAPLLLPTTDGVAMIYGSGGTTGTVSITNSTSVNPTLWSSVISPSSNYAMLDSSALSIGDTIYFSGLASSSIGSSTGTVNFFTYNVGASSATSETVIEPNVSSWQDSISVNERTLQIFFGSGSSIYYAYSMDLGKTFNNNVETISTSESAVTGLTSAYGATGVVWMSGTSNPYELKFFATGSVSINNDSPFPIHVVSLYVYDTVTSNLVHFDTNSSVTGVSGSFDYWMPAGQTFTIPESFPWNPSDDYRITVATDQGVLAAFYTSAPA